MTPRQATSLHMQPTTSADIIAFYNQVGGGGWLLPLQCSRYDLPMLIALLCPHCAVRS
jgi:hypothetical protein